MAKLKNYNGRYCESEYESAFIAFLQSVGWTYLPGNKIKRCYRDVLIADDFRALPDSLPCVAVIFLKLALRLSL